MKPLRFIPLLVIAAGLLAYHNSFKGEFIHDDVGSILENPTIRQLWPIWQPLSPPHQPGLTVVGRPLINLSLAVNYALGGYHVWGYHALNLAVHILAGLILLGIVRRTLLQPRLRDRFGAAANELAVATAVLWTIHPLQTESVTFVIQRAESIMGLFYLLTLYCFIRGAESSSRPWYGLSVVACALGMASKEVMVSAPVMVMLYDRAFLSGSFREAWQRRRPLYLALASTWILLGFLVVTGQLPVTLTIAKRVDLTSWEYLATQPGVILHYLRLAAWPHPLGFDFYGWPIARTWLSIVPAAVVVVMLLGVSVWAWRKNPVWGFVGTWFFLILAPSSSFIPLHEVIYEHRMYLPLAAVLSAVVVGLYMVAGRRSLVVIAAVAAVGLGFLTWRRNQVYRSDITIRADAVARLPNDSRAHYNLGAAFGQAGRFQEAIAQYEEALQLDPNMADVHFSWGLALVGAGKFQEAVGRFEQAIRLRPDFAQAYSNLGSTLRELGRVPEAIGCWEQALRVDPGCAEAHYNLGVALLRAGDMSGAIGHWEQALRINPDLAEVHYNLGGALLQTGDMPKAVVHWQQAVRIKPDFAEVYYNLGNALLATGKLEDAIRRYEQAVRFKPDYADAHNNLGNALFLSGNVSKAIAHWEQAVRLKPDFAMPHYNLGIAYEQAGKIDLAIRHYEQAVQLKPDYAAAQSNLSRLRAAQ